MPTSDTWGKDWVRDKILSLSKHRFIHRVVDVGTGVGTYSDLLRRHLSEAQWIGIEAWEPYTDEFNLEEKYDIVHPYDVRDISDVLQEASIVILGDVLEHMPKNDAMDLIYQNISWPTILVICVPMLHLDQGPVNGNPYEIHLSENQWTEDEMTEFLEEMMHKPYAYSYSRLDKHVGDVVGYFVLS